jgi:hypothetical protein
MEFTVPLLRFRHGNQPNLENGYVGRNHNTDYFGHRPARGL